MSFITRRKAGGVRKNISILAEINWSIGSTVSQVGSYAQVRLPRLDAYSLVVLPGELQSLFLRTLALFAP